MVRPLEKRLDEGGSNSLYRHGLKSASARCPTTGTTGENRMIFAKDSRSCRRARK